MLEGTVNGHQSVYMQSRVELRVVGTVCHVVMFVPHELRWSVVLWCDRIRVANAHLAFCQAEQMVFQLMLCCVSFE